MFASSSASDDLEVITGLKFRVIIPESKDFYTGSELPFEVELQIPPSATDPKSGGLFGGSSSSVLEGAPIICTVCFEGYFEIKHHKRATQNEFFFRSNTHEIINTQKYPLQQHLSVLQRLPFRLSLPVGLPSVCIERFGKKEGKMTQLAVNYRLKAVLSVPGNTPVARYRAVPLYGNVLIENHLVDFINRPVKCERTSTVKKQLITMRFLAPKQWLFTGDSLLISADIATSLSGKIKTIDICFVKSLQMAVDKTLVNESEDLAVCTVPLSDLANQSKAASVPSSLTSLRCVGSSVDARNNNARLDLELFIQQFHTPTLRRTYATVFNEDNTAMPLCSIAELTSIEYFLIARVDDTIILSMPLLVMKQVPNTISVQQQQQQQQQPLPYYPPPPQ